MFSSALKSFSSNITSGYTLSSTPASYSGPWKIFDAKKKSTGKAVSVFIFDKKSLEPQASLGRSSAPSIKKAHEEVIERLKKEAASLARLRHPSILELVEPVEETRSGGLMFATEPVTASLAGLMAEKDGQEKAAGPGGRSSRFVVEDAEGGGRRRREVEIDDLEIQKGLLQVAKGLEFLHESAGLVHANLTPDAVYINAKSVLEKKLLPALLEEMKDRDLLSLTLQNVLKIVKMLPSGRRAFTEKVIPRLREIFLSGAASSTAKVANAERDSNKEAGLMVLLENIKIAAENCSGKEFKDDASLRCMPTVLPVLDYTTTRNELFPVVASVFSKTSSLGIKTRGLEALGILCGAPAEEPKGSGQESTMADNNGQAKFGKNAANAALDKYIVQEKVVPLLKAIKTKEPAVMMAALKVFRQVGKIADSEFIAIDVLPVLWSFCLGPLLNLEQFRSFMELIKSLSDRVEQEQIRKLQELSSSSRATDEAVTSQGNSDFLSFGTINGTGSEANANSGEADFERLVSGEQSNRTGLTNGSLAGGGWGSTQETKNGNLSVFSWSSPDPPPSSFKDSAKLGPESSSSFSLSPAVNPPSRTITPDLSGFATLTPSALIGEGVAASRERRASDPGSWSDALRAARDGGMSAARGQDELLGDASWAPPPQPEGATPIAGPERAPDSPRVVAHEAEGPLEPAVGMEEAPPALEGEPAIEGNSPAKAASQQVEPADDFPPAEAAAPEEPLSSPLGDGAESEVAASPRR
ncbi:MAG: hypothetical protein M1826_000910 [Phylliscum demangeonii]|nr:MAG: hypothetical protein M1826_000910 [Phylliscum demangeonii]